MNGCDDTDTDEVNERAGGKIEWRVVERRHYDPEGVRGLTTVVIEAVAAAEKTPITNIREPPLYDAVDIFAVEDALFDAGDAAARRASDASVAFDYHGFRVTIQADGRVVVAEPVGDSGR